VVANSVTWFEIIGKDAAGLQRFYREVFGWKLTPPVKEMGNYSMLEDRGSGIAGGIGGSDEDNPRVSVYIETNNPDALAKKAERAGARIVMPVTQITPTTTIAMLIDPAGNTFGLLKAQPQQAAAPRATRRTATTTRASRPKTTSRARSASTARTRASSGSRARKGGRKSR
jgi:predicted enzyme related to lactoylglutathione lyase